MSNPATQHELTQLLGGIDQDIKTIFLSLDRNKLRLVFTKYGELYGVSKLIYAKNTYEHWKSGDTKMSGLVLARLLNLVPTALDAEARYELIKKLRQTHLRQSHLHVVCDPSNWFKKLPVVVDELIESSKRFELPPEVVEKLTWLTDGDALAAQELLVAAEVNEANVRTTYLSQEYSRIARMLASEKNISEFTHKIEIPQGSVTVIVKQLKLNLLQRMPLSPVSEFKKKRALSIICKNPNCKIEMITSLSVYDGEPVHARSSQITCVHCGVAHLYEEHDLSRIRRDLKIEVRHGLFGGFTIYYDCPSCSTRLISREKEIGTNEVCPKCKGTFIVPGHNSDSLMNIY